MANYSMYNCWEIMNCDNPDCPARLEPETPCWEIANRVGDYRTVSNTCKDCIVYILKEKAYVLSKKELNNIILERGLLKNIGESRQTSVLKASASG